MYAWGGNEYGQCGVHWGARDVVEPAPCVPSLRVVQVAAGGMHSCVLTTQGEVSISGRCLCFASQGGLQQCICLSKTVLTFMLCCHSPYCA